MKEGSELCAFICEIRAKRNSSSFVVSACCSNQVKAVVTCRFEQIESECWCGLSCQHCINVFRLVKVELVYQQVKNVTRSSLELLEPSLHQRHDKCFSR